MPEVKLPTLSRRLTAELLGTALLVAIVVGSGIAAQQLSPGDVGLQLLQNSTATVLGLTVLILVFGPVARTWQPRLRGPSPEVCSPTPCSKSVRPFPRRNAQPQGTCWVRSLRP